MILPYLSLLLLLILYCTLLRLLFLKFLFRPMFSNMCVSYSSWHQIKFSSIWESGTYCPTEGRWSRKGSLGCLRDQNGSSGVPDSYRVSTLINVSEGDWSSRDRDPTKLLYTCNGPTTTVATTVVVTVAINPAVRREREREILRLSCLLFHPPLILRLVSPWGGRWTKRCLS